MPLRLRQEPCGGTQGEEGGTERTESTVTLLDSPVLDWTGRVIHSLLAGPFTLAACLRGPRLASHRGNGPWHPNKTTVCQLLWSARQLKRDQGQRALYLGFVVVVVVVDIVDVIVVVVTDFGCGFTTSIIH